MNPIPTDAAGVVTIIQHHEKSGARPASLNLSCPVKLLKFARVIPGTEQTDAKGKAIKTACPFARAVKHSTSNVIVNFDYAGNVNRQRDREGKEADFEAQENWFFHVSKAVVQHRKSGERYIFVRVLKSLDDAYFTAGEAGDEVIERARLVPYLPADDLSDIERGIYGLAPQVRAPKQELESEIQPITFKLANLRVLVIDGFTYVLTPEPTEATPASITVTTPEGQPITVINPAGPVAQACRAEY